MKRIRRLVLWEKISQINKLLSQSLRTGTPRNWAGLNTGNKIKNQDHHSQPWARSVRRKRGKENRAEVYREEMTKSMPHLTYRGMAIIPEFLVPNSSFCEAQVSFLSLDSMWVSVTYNNLLFKWNWFERVSVPHPKPLHWDTHLLYWLLAVTQLKLPEEIKIH